MLRLIQLATAAGGVATGEWSGTEPMGEHAEQDGQADRTDHLIDGAFNVVQTLESNEREDDGGKSPRSEPTDEEHRGPVHSGAEERNRHGQHADHSQTSTAYNKICHVQPAIKAG